MSLDDPVASHVPSCAEVGWAEGATVRDLLANRSGLPLRAELEFGFAGDPDTDDAALARLAAEAGEGGGPAATSGRTPTWAGVARAGRRVRDGRSLGSRDAAAPVGPGSDARDDLRHGGRVRSRVSGYEVTAWRRRARSLRRIARAYGPAGTSGRLDGHGPAAVCGGAPQEPSLAALRAVHAEVAIYGWLNAWCLGWARFELGGWSGLGVGGAASAASGESCGSCRSMMRPSP